jgi:hypothetical protein
MSAVPPLRPVSSRSNAAEVGQGRRPDIVLVDQDVRASSGGSEAAEPSDRESFHVSDMPTG